MKKAIGLVVFGVALVAGGLTYNVWSPPSEQALQQTIAQPKREILSYVPADTFMFFGGLEAVKMQDMQKLMMPGQQSWMSTADLEALQNADPQNPAAPAIRMLSGLMVEYTQVLKTPETMVTQLGVNEELDLALYTVGVLPVLRVALNSSAEFTAFLDRAEQQGNTHHESENIDGVNLRVYRFDSAPTGKSAEFVIAVQNNYAVFTAAIPDQNRVGLLKQALGINKPSSSLADVQVLERLKDKHNFHAAFLGFVDHVQIVRGLTNPKSNEFGRMIEGFIQTDMAGKAQADPNRPHPMASIQTAACQEELLALAEKWPRSVAGYTKFAIDQKPMELDMVALLEVNDKELIADLKTLRGYVPAHLFDIKSKPVFGVGLGFNIDGLVPFVTKTIQTILQTPYKCEPLANMKQQLAASNGTAALGMASGVIAGLQGLSATVFDIDGNMDFVTGEPDIKSADAMVTVSATNPQGLLMMLKNMVPPLADIEIPADGSAVDLPLSLPFLPTNESVKIAIKGNHIVAYLGANAKAVADALTTVKLEQNALLAVNVDYAKYMKLLSQSLAQSAANQNDTSLQQEIQQMTNELESMDLQMTQIIDISNEGISATARTVY